MISVDSYISILIYLINFQNTAAHVYSVSVVVSTYNKRVSPTSRDWWASQQYNISTCTCSAFNVSFDYPACSKFQNAITVTSVDCIRGQNSNDVFLLGVLMYLLVLFSYILVFTFSKTTFKLNR